MEIERRRTAFGGEGATSSRAGSSWMSRKATREPCRAKWVTMDSPMPVAPPVTRMARLEAGVAGEVRLAWVVHCGSLLGTASLIRPSIEPVLGGVAAGAE